MVSNKIDRVLREQESLNYNNRFATVNRDTGKLLHILAKTKNPKKVLEIGTSIGYSSVWIASALNGGANLTTVEYSPERADIAKEFFKKSKLKIKLLEGDALKVIPKIKERFDLVFLDATKAQYLRYLKAVKLNKNSLVVADNTISHAGKMQDFLDYVNKRGAVTLNIGSGITLWSNS